MLGRCQNGSSSALNPRNQVQAGISGLRANPGRIGSTRQGLLSAHRLTQPLGKNWPPFPPKFLPSADFSELGSRAIGTDRCIPVGSRLTPVMEVFEAWMPALKSPERLQTTVR